MRRREPDRVLGPYRDGSGHKIIIVVGGTKTTRYCKTESEAEALKHEVEREIDRTAVEENTVAQAIEHYEAFLRDVKGNKPKSYKESVRRLRIFFDDPDAKISNLTPKRCADRYLAIAKEMAVDSHRNILAESKTFLGWCASSPRRWLRSNPLVEVKGHGRRKHGKPQLRIEEARRWCAKATELADLGDQGAVAAMLTMRMGLRAGEIVSRIARDLDDGGRLLWISDAKTEKGRRTVPVPPQLQPYLREQARDKQPGAYLFPSQAKQGRYRGGPATPDWVNDQVHRICTLANVPAVCAHSMRGLRATLDLLAGRLLRDVADDLGHEEVSTTLQSYAAPGATESAVQDRVAKILDGRS